MQEVTARKVPGGGDWLRDLPADPDGLCSAAVAKLEQHSGAALARLVRFMGLCTLEWEARGAVVRDAHGNEYVECGGYGQFFHGHGHPRVVEAVRRQAGELALSTRLLPNLPQAELSERLAAVAPGNLQYSFFCNSGTEAVEGALKLARLRTGRRAVLSTHGAFHGKTFGALSASGKDQYRDPFAPLVPDFHHVPFGDGAGLCQRAEELAAGPGGLAAIILEPVQGEAGVVMPPPGYLASARHLCDRLGAVLIFDEVQTGIGRTGAMFACESEGVVPDILCTAKALGGGVMPLGAFTATADCWQPFDDHPFLHTSTFGGNPLACAAGVAALEAIDSEALLQRAQALGTALGAGLRDIGQRHGDAVLEARGRGLLWGLDLRSEGVGGMMLSRLLDMGVLVVYSLNQPKVMRVMPPAVATDSQIEFVLEAIDRAAGEAAAVAGEL